MTQRKPIESELVSVARALDRASEELATTSTLLQRAPLTSQRHFEKAAEHLASLAAAEASLREHAAELERVMRALLASHATQAVAVAARAEHIAARRAELQRQLDRYAELAVRAMALAPSDAPGLAGELRALLGEARASDFPEVAHLAESLERQVSARRA